MMVPPPLLFLLALHPVSCRALAPPAPSAFLAKGPAKKRRWTPPSRTIGKAPFGGRFHRGIGDGNILGMVRGGDESESSDDNDGGDGPDESDGGSYEYDRSPDEDETDAEDESTTDLSAEDEEEDGSVADAVDEDAPAAAVQPTPGELARAQESARLSAQSRNLGVATALWASLFFDVILNDAKRSLLFPAATSPALPAKTLAPTVLLASGFGLASAATFLLWRDAEVRAEMLSSDDSECTKGDWFLSLSSPSNDEYDGESEEAREEFASQIRTRLFLHLSLFGLLGLAANAGRCFSAEAPFLGASGAIICGHNVLVCASALIQDGQPNFFRRREGVHWTEELPRVGPSLLYRVAAVFAWARCIPLCKRIASSGAFLLARGAGPGPSTVADGARRLCLDAASLARLALVAGACGALRASTSAFSRRSGLRRHPFFNVLGGALGLGFLGAGGASAFDAAGWTVAWGATGVLFGAFAACDAAAGFWGQRKEKRLSGLLDLDS